MYPLINPNYIRRSLIVNNEKLNPSHFVVSQRERIRQQLLSLGVTRLALMSNESRYLPHIIHPDEYIQGIVYGKSIDGFAMLVATDKRVIFLDNKPLFINEDEITYDVVSGVNYGHVGFGTTVTLHTRIKDYTIRTLNQRCAMGFVKYIEKRRLEHKYIKENHDHIN